MGRGKRFRETSATPEEDSYTYRVEWDGRLTPTKELFANFKSGVKPEVKNYGPGSKIIHGFDNAWDIYCDLKEDPDYIRVRLVEIDKNGKEHRRN